MRVLAYVADFLAPLVPARQTEGPPAVTQAPRSNVLPQTDIYGTRSALTCAR